MLRSVETEEAMTPDPEELKRRVREDYTPEAIPPCPVCNGPRDSICSAGKGRVTYCCSSEDAQPMGKGDKFEACMKHFSLSRWETASRDSRVLKLCDVIDASERREAELRKALEDARDDRENFSQIADKALELKAAAEAEIGELKAKLKKYETN